MQKKLDNISLIKMIMMILVVFYHSMLFFGGKWFEYVKPVYHAKYLYNMAIYMNTFLVQSFTMASGYLFYYLRREKNRYTNPKNDIKKRAKRLLIPYVFTCIIWVIPIECFFNNYSIIDIVRKYILMISPSQLWFLIMLFILFLFFVLYGYKVKLSLRNLIITYVSTSIIGFGLSFFNIEFFQIAKSIRFVLFFYLGGFIYLNKDKINARQIIIAFVLSIVMYFTNRYLDSLSIKSIHYFIKLFDPIISALEVCTIYYVFTIIINNKIIKTNSILYKVLNENSFGIYLFHQQIIYFTIVLFNGLVHPIIQVLLSFIISLSISLLMSIILKNNKVTRFMFGL